MRIGGFAFDCAIRAGLLIGTARAKAALGLDFSVGQDARAGSGRNTVYRRSLCTSEHARRQEASSL